MVDKINKAFALPSVMIASIVMLIVLGVAVSSVASVRNNLKDQFYQNIAKEASESGLAVASACISEGNTSWAQVIPSSGCQHQSNSPSASTAEDWIIDKPEYRVTYIVKKDSSINDNYISAGRVELKRASNGSVWQVYEHSTKQLEQSSQQRKLRWKSISAGIEHTCAIGSDNKAYCWGKNTKGQLGDGTTDSRNSPTLVQYGEIPAGSGFLQIAAGGQHTCAIATDANVYCWGEGVSGQLGDNSYAGSRITPVAVKWPSGISWSGKIKQINVGANSTCALDNAGKAYCWGNNSQGQLGDGTTVNRSQPVKISQGAMLLNQPIKQLASSSGVHEHNCAVGFNNKIYCWGRNEQGMLGDGTTSVRNKPVEVVRGEVPANIGFISVAVSERYTCAVAMNNRAYCWGYGHLGRLGNGSVSDKYMPTAVNGGDLPADANIKQVSAGISHGCALAADGKVYCWGFNIAGNLGDGTLAPKQSPVLVAQGSITPGVGVREISAGMLHTCALSADNEAYCWGSGGHGRIGSGADSAGVNSLAVKVKDVDDGSVRPLVAGSLSNGDGTNCAVGSDNWVYCWGSNANNRLGASVTHGTKVPVRVARGEIPPEATIQKVSTGGTASCVLASDNWVYCWGTNSKVAGSARAKAISRGHIPANVKIVDVSVGRDTACVIASDHRVYCWGEGRNYALGRGSSSEASSDSPLLLHVGQRPDLKAHKISVGNNYGCLIGSNGKIYCWGEGFYGRLANGSYSNHNQTPMAIQRGWLMSDYLAQDIATGLNTTCMISSDTQVYCWGSNNSGQSGTGASQSMLTFPRRVSSINNIDKVYVGKGVSDASVCAMRYVDTKVYCWGSGYKHALGSNSTSNSNIPKAIHNGQIPSGVPILDVSTGGTTGCALTAHFRPYCWGNNNNGQVGNQDAPLATVPVPSIVSDMPTYSYESNRRYLY